MIIVGYYTSDSTYAQHAHLLQVSVARFGIKCDLEKIEPEEWLSIVAQKPRIILDKIRKWQQPVLYLDADSVVLKDITPYFDGLNTDIAVHYKEDRELISSSLYFDYNPRVISLLEDWESTQKAHPHIWDQKVLQSVLEKPEHKDIRRHRLPMEFLYIFDLYRETHPDIEPAIEQLQASRESRHRKKMSTPKYRILSKLGIYPKSTRRLKDRRQRLAQLTEEFGCPFTFDYEP